MLFLLIIAFFATIGFYRQAKIASLHPGKIASIPLIAAGIAWILGYSIAYAIHWVSSRWDVSDSTIRLVSFLADAMIIVMYLLLIRQVWGSLLKRSTKNSGS